MNATQTAAKLIASWLIRGLLPEIEHTTIQRDSIKPQRFERLWFRLIPAALKVAKPCPLCAADWELARRHKTAIVAILTAQGDVCAYSTMDVPVEAEVNVAPSSRRAIKRRAEARTKAKKAGRIM